MLHTRNKTKNDYHLKVKRAAKWRWYAQMWVNTCRGYELKSSIQKPTMKEALDACIR